MNRVVPPSLFRTSPRLRKKGGCWQAGAYPLLPATAVCSTRHGVSAAQENKDCSCEAGGFCTSESRGLLPDLVACGRSDRRSVVMRW